MKENGKFGNPPIPKIPRTAGKYLMANKWKWYVTSKASVIHRVVPLGRSWIPKLKIICVAT